MAAVDLLRTALDLPRNSTVLELGAGTGKLSRLLAPTVGHYIALEPVRAMRERFQAFVPDPSLVTGVAERIPLRSSVVDGVTAAQAFHWFDGARAVAEIRRVLRPGGSVGLLGNLRDESLDWVTEASGILDRYDPGGPRFRRSRWQAEWDGAAGFSPLQHREFRFVHRAGRETILAWFTFMSFIAALPPARRAEAETAFRRLLDRHPRTSGRDPIDLSYICHVDWTRAQTDPR